MRSQQLARAALRAASGSRAGLRSAAIDVTVPSALRAPLKQRNSVAIASPAFSSATTRPFSTSSPMLKKKNKKNASLVDEDFEAVADEDGELGIEDDDLFGGVSSADAPTASSSASSSSRAGGVASRVDYAKSVEDFRRSLEWDEIDASRFPSLHKWRALAGRASTQDELTELLELAKIYRDRVGSLGTKSGERFASRASALGFPEIALNAFLDRYNYGLEYNVEALYLVQHGLAKKLRRNNKEELLASAEIEGAPVQETDLFGVVPPETAPAQESAEEPQEQQEGDGKAEAISERHQLDMQLARAQLAIIDRMALAASLAPTLDNTASHDPILLSYITSAYVSTFNLGTKLSFTNPLLTNVYARTNELIALLTATTESSLSHGRISALASPHDDESNHLLPKNRAADLTSSFATILSYVARHSGAKDLFRHPKTNRTLDPVRTLYRYMDHVGPSQSNKLVRRVEPLLQSYPTL
ncbi:hypothetical protein BCV70DRAFT_199434 [Testicularia cyperi]|uniref:Uncharacterized protein n=1 Tax=Testicularia cyperi TaxID=1882483 RepID=A0A317XRT5_9BASI|nr:hypothetical protein BCV70DRAFT_199434 [Testicularia cyperi]